MVEVCGFFLINLLELGMVGVDVCFLFWIVILIGDFGEGGVLE